MRTEDLRVQALKNPLGINENPVFSWQLVSDKKDERNETLGAVLVGAYIVGEKKDFRKAREYMDKIAPYSTRFDKLSNEFTYYKLKGDEKKQNFITTL